MAIAAPDQQRFITGLGCVTAAGRTTAGAPGLVRVSCLDDEGDPLKATVTRAPAHGIAAAPARIPAPYGWDDITVAWTPQPGFVGIDTLGLRVADGHGVHFDLVVNLYSYASGDAPAPASPTLPVSGRPSVGQAQAVAPVDQARRAGHARRRAHAPDRRRPRVRSPRRRAPRARRARRQHRARGHLPAGLPPRRPRQGIPEGRPWPGRRPRPDDGDPGARRGLKLSRRAAGVLRSSGAVAFSSPPVCPPAAPAAGSCACAAA